MEISKEREVFEKWAFRNSGGWAPFGKSNEGCYYNSKLQFAWEAWKEQATPEGFVLVPKEPTGAMLKQGSCQKLVGGSTAEIYKAMIEAQEQSHD
ncbi:hypothetical protein [Acinetobacter bereziniae]|uniref:hypothetical protein n=1 Tax=Acinetobacter bereziniae TaxID=106648 RepID=UPI00300AD148